jgi:hypothetical protein
LWQHMLMRVAVGIHMHDIEKAIETYNLMSQKYFTHARCAGCCAVSDCMCARPRLVQRTARSMLAASAPT